jgi:hypothetical protein
MPGLLEDYLTIDQFASELDVSPRTVRRWVAQGRGPVLTYIGHKPLVGLDDGRDYIKAQRRPLTRARRKR